jgi:hypothetical protein
VRRYVGGVERSVGKGCVRACGEGCLAGSQGVGSGESEGLCDFLFDWQPWQATLLPKQAVVMVEMMP